MLVGELVLPAQRPLAMFVRDVRFDRLLGLARTIAQTRGGRIFREEGASEADMELWESLNDHVAGIIRISRYGDADEPEPLSRILRFPSLRVAFEVHAAIRPNAEDDEPALQVRVRRSEVYCCNDNEEWSFYNLRDEPLSRLGELLFVSDAYMGFASDKYVWLCKAVSNDELEATNLSRVAGSDFRGRFMNLEDPWMTEFLTAPGAGERYWWRPAITDDRSRLAPAPYASPAATLLRNARFAPANERLVNLLRSHVVRLAGSLFAAYDAQMAFYDDPLPD